MSEIIKCPFCLVSIASSFKVPDHESQDSKDLLTVAECEACGIAFQWPLDAKKK